MVQVCHVKVRTHHTRYSRYDVLSACPCQFCSCPLIIVCCVQVEEGVWKMLSLALGPGNLVGIRNSMHDIRDEMLNVDRV